MHSVCDAKWSNRRPFKSLSPGVEKHIKHYSAQIPHMQLSEIITARGADYALSNLPEVDFYTSSF